MPELKDKERTQRIALIGLIVVAAVVACIRFGPKLKPASAKESKPAAASDLVSVPAYDARVIATWQQPLPEAQPYVAVARDIFGLPRRSGGMTENGQPMDGNRLRLGAVMEGRDGAVARINNAYAKVGDRVGHYKVVDIALDSVVLESDEESLVLTLVR